MVSSVSAKIRGNGTSYNSKLLCSSVDSRSIQKQDSNAETST